MNFNLKGKKALVTGGSKGIGKALVTDLIENGAEVYYFSRTQGEGIAEGHWIECDLTRKESIEEALEHLFEQVENLDILVNNAGITRDGLLMRMSDEAWGEVLEVNLTAVFRICRRVSRLMANRRQGTIVNISSIVGVTGNGGQTNYSASKAGLIGFSKSLAKELASRHVRVNVVAPGFIETEMTEALPLSVKEDIFKQIPLGRLGAAHEVSSAILFLCSQASSYITGEVLAVTGGLGM